MFKLLRYFSVTSLLAFMLVAALPGIFYRQLVLSNLVLRPLFKLSNLVG